MMDNENIAYPFKHLIYTLLLFLMGSMFLSCEKPPNYSEGPYIEFKAISSELTAEGNDLGNEENVITVDVYFEDGDGDLGINQQDAESSVYDGYRDDSVWIDPVVQCYNVIDTVNGQLVYDRCDTIAGYWDPIYYNLRVKMLRKNVFGEFEEVELTAPLSSRFDPLFDEEGVLSPIDGVLKFRIRHINDGIILRKGDEVKYELYCFDRKNNQSNTILTDPVFLFIED